MLAKLRELCIIYAGILLSAKGDSRLFTIGDYIAHPLHGAGKIDDIVKRKTGSVERDYYVLKLPVSEMRVMIPVDGCENIGVRPIIAPSEAESVLSAFSSLDISMTANWNKRYRENMQKIKSGDLMEVASVVKGLMSRDAERGLSTGERKMLHSAKQIFISEMVVSLDCSYEAIEERLDSAFA